MDRSFEKYLPVHYASIRDRRDKTLVIKAGFTDPGVNQVYSYQVFTEY
jgi:hypothetical protein